MPSGYATPVLLHFLDVDVDAGEAARALDVDFPRFRPSPTVIDIHSDSDSDVMSSGIAATVIDTPSDAEEAVAAAGDVQAFGVGGAGSTGVSTADPSSNAGTHGDSDSDDGEDGDGTVEDSTCFGRHLHLHPMMQPTWLITYIGLVWMMYCCRHARNRALSGSCSTTRTCRRCSKVTVGHGSLHV